VGFEENLRRCLESESFMNNAARRTRDEQIVRPESSSAEPMNWKGIPPSKIQYSENH